MTADLFRSGKACLSRLAVTGEPDSDDMRMPLRDCQWVIIGENAAMLVTPEYLSTGQVAAGDNDRPDRLTTGSLEVS